MVSGDEPCPFQHALEMLGRRHALEILWALQQRSPRRFTEIKRALGLNPVTLSERLDEFESCGVLDRTVYGETPPRVEYGLTKKGRDLLVVLDNLSKWAKTYPVRQTAGATV